MFLYNLRKKGKETAHVILNCYLVVKQIFMRHLTSYMKERVSGNRPCLSVMLHGQQLI